MVEEAVDKLFLAATLRAQCGIHIEAYEEMEQILQDQMNTAVLC